MNRNILVSFIFMITMPLIGLVQSLYVKDRSIKKWALIAFITIYGSVIRLTPGTDGFVHQGHVENYYSQVTFEKFLNDTFDILTFSTNYNVDEDLFIHFLSYLCAGVLGLPKLFFVLVSFVYGYFYSSSLFRLIKILPNYKYSFIFYTFLTLFVLFKSIEGINTVRTWTGMWILFYAVLSYLETKKLKYFLLMFVPPYIHVGYFAMAIPAWIVVIFGSWPKVFSILFFLSFSFNLINPASVTQQLEETEVGAEKVRAYSQEEEITTDAAIAKASSKGSTWYKTYAKAGFHLILIYILALVIIFKGYYPNKMNSIEVGLFSIGLLTKVLSSASWFLYALSNRSAVIAAIFLLAAFISMAQRGAFNIGPNKQVPVFENTTFRFVLIGLIPFFILKISELGEFLSLFMISAPFIVWFDSSINISIKEGFKALTGF